MSILEQGTDTEFMSIDASTMAKEVYDNALNRLFEKNTGTAGYFVLTEAGEDLHDEAYAEFRELFGFETGINPDTDDGEIFASLGNYQLQQKLHVTEDNVVFGALFMVADRRNQVTE